MLIHSVTAINTPGGPFLFQQCISHRRIRAVMRGMMQMIHDSPVFHGLQAHAVGYQSPFYIHILADAGCHIVLVVTIDLHHVLFEQSPVTSHDAILLAALSEEGEIDPILFSRCAMFYMPEKRQQSPV